MWQFQEEAALLGLEDGREGVCQVKCSQGGRRAFQAKKQVVPRPGDEMVLGGPVSSSICCWHSVERWSSRDKQEADHDRTCLFICLFSYSSLCSRRVFKCLEGL